MRHDDDIGVSVTRMLDDMPANTKKKVLSTRCKEIERVETKLRRFANDMVNERATDASTPMLRSDKNASELRR